MTGRRWLRLVLGAASLTFAAVLLILGVPWVTGVSWAEIVQHLSGLDPVTIAWLVLLWLAGLWAYTFLLTASLPGLTNLQAFTMNAAGSAVSNLLPFGGAAGVAVTFAMARSWGLRTHAVVVSTLVSGIWNALGRLALPAVGLIVLLAAGEVPNGKLAAAAGVATAVLAAALLAVLAALWKESAAVLVGRVVDAVSRALPRRWRPVPGRAGGALVRVRQSTIKLIRKAWRQMTLAQLAYLGLQFALLVGCLAVTGAYVGLAITFAAFALSRVLTTIVITPGGVGVSETGSAALLIALGVPAAPAAAGILLFAFFTFVIEIPVGGVAWAAWTLAGRWRHADTAPVQEQPQEQARER